MTQQELDDLISYIRRQASTWLGDEASEAIERLIQYTTSLQKKVGHGK